MVANRNKVLKWFITFPHSREYTPKSFLLSLFTLACVVSVAGCRETHDDGVTPHLHLNIHLKKNYGLTKTQLLKKIENKFPDDFKRIDVRTTRESPKKAKEGYLSKEDADVYYWTDEVHNQEKKKEKWKRDICNLMLSSPHFLWKINLKETCSDSNWDNMLGKSKGIVWHTDADSPFRVCFTDL